LTDAPLPPVAVVLLVAAHGPECPGILFLFLHFAVCLGFVEADAHERVIAKFDAGSNDTPVDSIADLYFLYAYIVDYELFVALAYSVCLNSSLYSRDLCHYERNKLY
jgi:hypothetical protein